MLAQTRSTPFRLGFLARLYLLIAALVALLMLVAGTSLVAIGRLQGNAEQISSTAAGQREFLQCVAEPDAEPFRCPGRGPA
ncbi:hypothetical protein [Stutzerimonas balearica]|uniref:hypothetical protein n=1 Tax=Stutzerimonas balearica TaxID=74829 RepID=UPI00289C00C3|nr:hypothetical protein [Stutzerimonas balearica]